MIENKNIKVKALFYSAKPPSDDQKKELIDFLSNKYKTDITLSWQEDRELTEGFRLEVWTIDKGVSSEDKWNLDSVYDWSLEGRLQQLEEEINHLSTENNNIIPLIKETIQNWTPEALEQEIGTVLTVGDGIATVSGLPNVIYNEILIFSSGIRGMVQELKRDEIGCILFDDGQSITEGSTVKRTGKTAGIPVGDSFKGRVIDAMGKPIDGKGPIKADGYRPIDRKSVV